MKKITRLILLSMLCFAVPLLASGCLADSSVIADDQPDEADGIGTSPVDGPDAGDVNVVSNSTARLRIRVQANDVESITVHYGPRDPNAKWKDQPMYRMGQNLGLESFACLINSDAKSIGYVIKIKDGSEQFTFSPSRWIISLTFCGSFVVVFLVGV